MTVFQVLPTPPDAPLSVPSLERGVAMTFTEASVGSPPAITLRIARLPADLGFPTDNPPQDPDFLLSVGGSAAVIPQQPSKLSITDQNGATVATANYLPDTFDIFRIVITLLRPGSRTWTLQIHNNDKQSRNFVAVVAANDNDARQPWINVLPTLELTSDGSSSAVLSATIRVQNFGTGSLSMTPIGLTDPFSVAPPDDIGPNASGTLQIQYDPTKSGSLNQSLTVASNDDLASGTSGHNKTVTVSYRKKAPDPPAQNRPCLFNDGCLQFKAPRGNPEGKCTDPRCGHPGVDHPPQNV